MVVTTGIDAGQAVFQLPLHPLRSALGIIGAMD